MADPATPLLHVPHEPSEILRPRPIVARRAHAEPHPPSRVGVNRRRVVAFLTSVLLGFAGAHPASAETPSAETPSERAEDAESDAPTPDADATDDSSEISDDIEEMVVEAEIMDELLQGLALRETSDLQLNLMSAADLSKFAASDVADALKRVPGVTVVEGQFAIIRGLEDRYSSTMFNGAPVPSPDPDRQSVQLDLFPSDIVSNLVVAKTFGPDSPSKSSGGSIDVVTTEYPEAPTIKFSLGGGIEEGAEKRFLKYKDGSTVGKEADPTDVIESDVSGMAGGRWTLLDHDVRFKGAVAHEIDYRSEQGFQESRQPSLPTESFESGQTVVTGPGGLALGELALSDGKFAQIQSTRSEQLTGFAALGADIDEAGAHRIDATYFHTEKQDQIVEQRENGYFKDLDYSGLIQATQNGELNAAVLSQQLDPVSTLGSRLGPRGLREETSEEPDRGALWFDNFGRSNSFERNRKLDVYQINGVHEIEFLDGLDITWATNYATTKQDDKSLGMRFTYEPCGFAGLSPCPSGGSPIAIPTRFPVRVSDLGPGKYFASGIQGGIIDTATDVKETQYFARLDAEQEVALSDFAQLDFKTGLWWEKAKRDVDATFVENVTVNGRSQWALGSPSLSELGNTLFDQFDPNPAIRNSQTEASKEITAGHAQLKLTLWESFDVLGGVRYENIYIDSKNSPFTGEEQLGRPATFPTAYLFFDRLDNPALGEVTLGTDTSGVTFNDQILGIHTPVDPTTGFVDLLTREQILSLVDGKIDENKVLPAVGIAYRPIDGLALRASYSETVARPSFREMGYYVTVQPGTDERILGNPQVGLSEVKSYDARAEYIFGELGDLVALSSFYKVIDDPIESIILRNPLDLDSGSAAQFRTFFNNPNTARLWGIEIEARKSFDFLAQLGLDFPGIELFDYLSVGGNFSWIDASVARTPTERARAQRFFLVPDGETARFPSLNRKRRLFGQPEWIGNADVSFDHPDWGTTVTLAVFAISDVLDAAGSAGIGKDRVNADTLTLDRYLDDYYQLDFIASQEIWQGISIKLSVKNLTDTRRRRVYDREQTAKTYVERMRQYGRDWSLSVGYAVDF